MKFLRPAITLFVACVFVVSTSKIAIVHSYADEADSSSQVADASSNSATDDACESCNDDALSSSSTSQQDNAASHVSKSSTSQKSTKSKKLKKSKKSTKTKKSKKTSSASVASKSSKHVSRSSSSHASSAATISAACRASSAAESATETMTDRESELSKAKATYKAAKARVGKLKRQRKTLEKRIAIKQTAADKAQAVIDAIETERENSQTVGIIEVLTGKARFDDIDSREYLLQKVADDRTEALASINKLKNKLTKKSNKLQKAVARAQKAKRDAMDAGNTTALKVEQSASQSRALDTKATTKASKLKNDTRGSAAKASVKSAKASHAASRSDAYDTLNSWYFLVADDAGVENTISFGTGADFALSKDEFVEKWSGAIAKFYDYYDSLATADVPLGAYSETIARMAYTFRIDPRLCAAVSIVESSGGLHCIRPHNAWGWGAADSDPYNLASEWDSWEEAIEAWHCGVATSSAGYKNAKSLDEFGAIYCSSADWSDKVAKYMQIISDYADETVGVSDDEKSADISSADETSGDEKSADISSADETSDDKEPS